MSTLISAVYSIYYCILTHDSICVKLNITMYNYNISYHRTSYIFLKHKWSPITQMRTAVGINVSSYVLYQGHF